MSRLQARRQIRSTNCYSYAAMGGVAGEDGCSAGVSACALYRFKTIAGCLTLGFMRLATLPGSTR
jgi:hypothetical protein